MCRWCTLSIITIYTTRHAFLPGCEGFLQTIDTSSNRLQSVPATQPLSPLTHCVWLLHLYLAEPFYYGLPDPGQRGQTTTQANRSHKLLRQTAHTNQKDQQKNLVRPVFSKPIVRLRCAEISDGFPG